MVALLKTLLILTMTPKTYLIQVIRKATGDIKPFVPCVDGTFIVRNDATHSIYCTKSLSEAGCDLRFTTSTNVGFIPTNLSHFSNLEITSSSSNQICSYSYQPFIGDMYLQDYPRNIFKAIWTNETGVQTVNESITFSNANQGNIKVYVTDHWPGILLKIYIECVNNQGKLFTIGSARRCVLIKYEGHVDYPLTAATFGLFETTTTTRTTKTATTTPLEPVAIRSDDGDDLLIYAIIAAVGATVFVLAICVTIVVICQRLKRKRQQHPERGNNTQPPASVQVESTQQKRQNKKLKQNQQHNINKNKNTQINQEQVLAMSPVVSTDSRTPPGRNNYTIETSGARPESSIYIGENDNIKTKDGNYSNKGYTSSKSKSRMKAYKNINFDKDFEKSSQKSDRDSKGYKSKQRPTIDTSINVDLDEPDQSSSEFVNAVNGNYDNNIVHTTPVHSHSKSRMKAPRTTTNFDEEFEQSSQNTQNNIQKTKTKKRPNIFSINDEEDFDNPHQRSSPKQLLSLKETKTIESNIDSTQHGEHETGVHRRVIHVEGQHPDSYDEDDFNRTSESIEAMFSFSNEISLDENFDDDEEGDEDRMVEPVVDVEFSSVPVFDDEETTVENDDSEDDKNERFATRMPSRNQNKNPIYTYTYADQETEDVLMF